MFSMLWRAIGRPSEGAIRVGVDLQMLSPGGANGGIKQAIYLLLRGMQTTHTKIEFSFIVNRILLREVEDAFPGSAVISVRPQPHPFGIRARTKPNLRCALAFLHCSSIYAPLWYSPACRLGKPMTALIVDLLHREYPEFVPSVKERVWRDELIAAAIQRSFRIQTISHYAADRISDFFAVPQHRLFVTYLPRLLHDEFPVKGDIHVTARPYFLYPANLWPHKNHEMLLEAFTEYCSRGGDWNIVLTGFSMEDPRMGTLKRVAAELRLSDSTVRFMGHLPDAEYTAILKGASALVFPSRYEGFGMPIVEAMANGVPVASSSAAALPEVAGGAALLFDPIAKSEIADAMWKMSSSPGLREEYKRRGFARAAEFSAKREYHKLARVFEEAAASKGRSI